MKKNNKIGKSMDNRTDEVLNQYLDQISKKATSSNDISCEEARLVLDIHEVRLRYKDFDSRKITS